MSTYAIAIPTSGRAGVIQETVLRWLQEENVLPGQVYLFVAPAELGAYARELSGTPWESRMVVGAPGLDGQRNAITDFFSEREAVLQVDDDIVGLDRVTGKKLERVSLDLVAQYGFGALSQCRARLWGVYPVRNAGFMSQNVAYGVKFCTGGIFGVLNDRAIRCTMTGGEKEDYERSILYAQRYGANLRLEWVTYKGKIFAGHGGMQQTRTPASLRAATEELLAKYPGWAVLNRARLRTGRWEVLLRAPGDAM